MPFIGTRLQWNWNGPSVIKEIDKRIDAQMIKLGQQVVEIAKTYAPVRTGRLQAALRFDYNLITHTLVFTSDVPYDIFTEYGTRNMAPRPHWRPALNTVGPVYGFNLEMAFANVPAIKAPILARGAGFQLPSNLTEKQLIHVRKHLLPTSKRHHISNVSRTKMKIRKYLW